MALVFIARQVFTSFNSGVQEEGLDNLYKKDLSHLKVFTDGSLERKFQDQCKGKVTGSRNLKLRKYYQEERLANKDSEISKMWKVISKRKENYQLALALIEKLKLENSQLRAQNEMQARELEDLRSENENLKMDGFEKLGHIFDLKDNLSQERLQNKDLARQIFHLEGRLHMNEVQQILDQKKYGARDTKAKGQNTQRTGTTDANLNRKLARLREDHEQLRKVVLEGLKERDKRTRKEEEDVDVDCDQAIDWSNYIEWQWEMCSPDMDYYSTEDRTRHQKKAHKRAVRKKLQDLRGNKKSKLKRQAGHRSHLEVLQSIRKNLIRKMEEFSRLKDQALKKLQKLAKAAMAKLKKKQQKRSQKWRRKEVTTMGWRSRLASGWDQRGFCPRPATLYPFILLKREWWLTQPRWDLVPPGYNPKNN
ncbi:golgin subfamily A member 6-like protein 1 [Macrobrachium rosenbergii]|uniref:golgin subfamily A member 6-like protein 1 n=1 Tax=Macrobrachium rosenbergii TaxID=79674 RepID=UPI0034D686F3